MKLVIEKDGSILKGPSAWTRNMADACGLAGNKRAPATPYTLADDSVLREVVLQQVSALKWQAVRETGPGSVNADGQWEIPREAVDMELYQAQGSLKAEIAAKRYTVEVGGITINGVPVATDRDSQGKYTAARIIAKEDATYTVNWKTEMGFVALDAATIIAMADAVRVHIQACFDREAVLSGEVDIAADLDALRAINIEAGWPG